MIAGTRQAVIDVGTNSLKLLVAEWEGSEVRPVWEGSRQTRLGEGFYTAHRLQPTAIERTAAGVMELANIANREGASSIRIFATSAARDATNQRDLVEAIRRTTGLEVEIISGDQEAEWAFRGVTSDVRLQRDPLLLLDLGGGSTEFILGQGERKHFQRSFPIGTVRLMEGVPHSDPPKLAEMSACRAWLKTFLAKEVRPQLATAIQREQQRQPGAHVQLVGTGGTATILAAMHQKLEGFDREKIEAAPLSLVSVKEQAARLWSLPLDQRKQIRGLPANRADVILTGVLVYEAVMEEFGFADLRVSTRGLRFGAVMAGGGPP